MDVRTFPVRVACSSASKGTPFEDSVVGLSGERDARRRDIALAWTGTGHMTEEHIQNERAAPKEENPEAAPVQSERERAAPVTWETFSARFDRSFGRAYAYASRRVKDQASCERIVGELLEANLDLLVDRDDEEQDLRPLKTALDRLIGLELARGLAAGEVGR